jgi:hypothetical protein
MADIPLPNKCAYCGLRMQYVFQTAAETAGSDRAFSELRVLYNRKVIKQMFPRIVGMSNIPGDFGSSAFCAVASKAWNKNSKRCAHWSLRVDGASVADYLSIYEDRRTYGATFWFGVVAVLSLIVAIVQTVR